MKEYFGKLKLKTVILMCLGVLFIGVGVSLLRLSNCGTDPFSCMNIGVSNHLPFGYGTYQLIVNIVLFIPMLVFYRNGIGIGTIVNMAGVAYCAEFCCWIFGCVDLTPDKVLPYLWARIIFLVLGLLVLCFGIALYMECALGIAPYDALALIVEKLTKDKIKFKWARVFTDFICVLIGFLAGAVVGIATIVTAFFTGPLVNLFREKVVRKWLSEQGE